MALGHSTQQPTLALTYGTSTGSSQGQSGGHAANFGHASSQGAGGQSTAAGAVNGSKNRGSSSSNTETDVPAGGSMDADVAANAIVVTHALRGCAGLAAVPTGGGQLLAWPSLLQEMLQICCMPQVCECACVFLFV